ncbi:MAG TPA: glycosyltransferase family 4 protein [Candidatus Acidoferrum sp.]|jgi:colanic acid biosynthesis glycosyl transferase WcaI|nr:glycosyltransferase family 4 protein [Candidatus Acidoferrum sp.]
MRFLLLNQTFHPDVMATGQHLADLALGLVARGHQVTVVTSRRAYDHPETLFPKTETWRGVRIVRIGSTGFGKGARWRRAADFASFLASCSFRLAVLPRHDAVVALTSPPLISFLGAWLTRLRGGRFFYWVMDFNPDEAIAAGWLRKDSLAARCLELLSRFSLEHSAKIVALDRFMRDRITAKGIATEKIAVLPPGSQDDQVRFDPAGREAFRRSHGLEGKFVIMYSGNHSPCHPLDTLMAAADKMKEDGSLAFCFVGGGSEFSRVKHWAEQGGYRNVVCVPYQPLNQLAASLSAADAHLVVMGDPFVGLVHPCKIYNILAVGAPVLYIGPRPSHITEILGAEPSTAATAPAPSAATGAGGFVWASARHGDIDSVVGGIKLLREASASAPRKAPEFLTSEFSREALLPRLISTLEA